MTWIHRLVDGHGPSILLICNRSEVQWPQAAKDTGLQGHFAVWNLGESSAGLAAGTDQCHSEEAQAAWLMLGDLAIT